MGTERPVLVTGANGFIGSHLVERLLARGRRVRAFLRPSGDAAFVHPDAERVYGDVTRPATLPRCLEGVEQVYHVAGALASFRDRTLYDVNEAGTRSLVRACVRSCPDLRRFVLVSSLAAVGPSASGRPRREDEPPRPVSHYGASKLGGERAAVDAADGIPVTIVRPPVVYGPRDRGLLTAFALVLRGVVPSFGRDKYYSFCNVDDLVAGIVAAGESPRGRNRAFHLADPRAVSLVGFLAVVGEALSVEPRRLPIPGPLLPLVAGVADAVASTLGLAARPVRDKVRELRPDYWIADTTRARRELGFRTSVPLARGIAETAEFYRRSGWLSVDGP
jgi:nucleoside-diphosphate-sugar epimerase